MAGWVCVAGWHVWQGGMRGGCMAGGVHGRGVHGKGVCMAGEHAWWGHACQERRPLQQTLRILRECILVSGCFDDLHMRGQNDIYPDLQLLECGISCTSQEKNG